mmetsp:Transcript_51792/g.93152  ORF Transcript_51792/g.93152 Transcript_51792/m.93152 type:complete len:87 (+) Transcript_51792:86-346(+)
MTAPAMSSPAQAWSSPAQALSSPVRPMTNALGSPALTSEVERRTQAARPDLEDDRPVATSGYRMAGLLPASSSSEEPVPPDSRLGE